MSARQSAELNSHTNGAPKQKSRLAEKLISKGVLTAPQLDLALHEQKRSGGALGPVLVQLGFVDARVLAEVLAGAAETNTVNLNRLVIEQDALRLVPLEMARRYKAMPIALRNHTLSVALADPFDVVAIDSLHQITGLSIEVATASSEDILNCQELYYRSGDTIEESIGKILEEKALESVQPIEEVLTKLGDTADDAPVIRLVSSIILRAINSGASDIHFEPQGADDAHPQPPGRRLVPGSAHSQSHAIGGGNAHEDSGGP